jgi:hypothetical protein
MYGKFGQKTKCCTHTHTQNSDFAYGNSSMFSNLTSELKNSHPEYNIQIMQMALDKLTVKMLGHA